MPLLSLSQVNRLGICAAVLLFICLGQAVCSEEEHPDLLDLADRIRNRKPLTREEETYLKRVRKQYHMSRNGAADHIEKNARENRRLMAVEATKKKPRTRQAQAENDEARLWPSVLEVVGVIISITVVLICLLLWVRHRMFHRRLDASIRAGKGASELLGIGTKVQPQDPQSQSGGDGESGCG